jgi:hypothetical protein
MDIDTVVHWAWPRSRTVSLQTIDWRERLFQALRARIGRPPTVVDLQYDVQSVPPDGGHVASLTVYVDRIPHTFRGAPQDGAPAAIRCVSWVALMHLHTEGVLRCGCQPDCPW